MTLPRIKEIRNKLNMTQAELSDYLDKEKGLKISRGTLAKYESGVNFPSEKTLDNLAKALNVSEFYLSGQGTQKEDIEDKLINLLHQKYFNVSDNTDNLHRLLKTYLLFKGDYNKPLSFYQNEDGDVDETAEKTRFPRFAEINDFWKNEFPFLFNDIHFTQSLIGTTDNEFTKKVFDKLKKQYDKDVDDRNFDILIDEVDGISTNIQLTASDVINNKKSKKELLTALDNGIKKLEWIKSNFFNNQK